MATAYLVDEDQFRRLLSIERRLHGDGSFLTPDGRRDLANTLSLLREQVQAQPWADIPGGEG